MKFLLFILFAASLNAANVKLSWSPNPEPEQVTKYTIYYSQISGQLTNSHSVSSPDPATVPKTLTISNLIVGRKYYFAITASNAVGESDLSGEISSTVMETPPTTPAPLERSLWVVSVTSEELVSENNSRSNAIDGNPATFWHSKWAGSSLPQSFSVGWVDPALISAVTYLPRQDGGKNGSIKAYKLYSSVDGLNWRELVTGEFSFTPSEKTITFPPVEAKHVRLTAISDYSTSGTGWAAIAEFKVIGVIIQNIPEPTPPIGVLLEVIESARPID